LLESTRAHIEKRHKRSLAQRILRRVAIEQIFPYPLRMKLALWPALLLRKLVPSQLLPRFVRDSLALLPDRLSSQSLPETSARSMSADHGRAGFVSGCVMSVLFGSTNAASIRLLNSAGYDVVTPAGQVCCGALFSHGGQLEKARECARRNIEIFEKLNIEAIVINAAGCGSTLKEYGHLLDHDRAWAERARAFSAKVRDLTEVLRLPPPESPASLPPRSIVTVHDACHLAHAQRITLAPRELVKSRASEHFVELPESDVCCGSAGSYNLTEPAMAERLQTRKVENVLKSRAKIVVTTNPGCILQIRAGLQKAGRTDIEVLHIADYLERVAIDEAS
jgi:glycolate oxidase iron-sulfur subunit